MKNRCLGGCPRIAKTIEMRDKGEYKIRPYKGSRGASRGEPCVHPAFSDSLLAKTNFIFYENFKGGITS